jgi:mRNA-degrading endonuclease RelE of RelBE toxin-antitoxin system
LPYDLIFSVPGRHGLRLLSARDRSTVLAEIDVQLLHQAEVETTNRKRMRPNKLGIQWELRVGDLRVFYNVEDNVVNILFIGTKRGNEVYVGTEKLEL